MKTWRIIAASLGALTATAHAVPAPLPLKPQGGLDPSTIVNVPVNGGVMPLDLGDIGGMAYQSIPISNVGIPRGIAGLDGSGNMTAPVITQAAWPSMATYPTAVATSATVVQPGGLFTDPVSSEPIVHLNIPRTDENGGRFGIDPDGIQIGGDLVNDFPGQGVTGPYQNGAGSRGSLGSARIGCHPYGNYDAATCLFIDNSAFDREGSRAGVGAGLEASATALASYAAFENVLLEMDSDAPAPRLVLQNVTYDASHIYMPGCAAGSSTNCAPLTAAQMAQLRVGMSITTNSIPAADVGQNILGGTSHTLPANHLYSAFVSSWDSSGKFITIQPGWAVMGDPANSGSGAIPPVNSLDTVWTNFAVPTAMFGTELKDFSEHHIIANHYLPQGQYGQAYNEITHAFSDGETDFVNYDPIDYADVFQGPTISYSVGNQQTFPAKDANCNPIAGQTVTRYVNLDPSTHQPINLDSCGTPNGHGSYPTSDSYGLFIAGGFGTGGGSLLRLTAGYGEHEINSTAFNTYGMGSTAATQGATWEIGEFDGQADTNHLRLVNWVQRSSNGNSGWQNNEYDLGLWIDGTAQDPWANTTLTGTQMARIAFNHGTNLGGMDLIANNGTDVLSLNGAGNAAVNASLSTGGNITAGGQITSTLAIIDQGANFYFQGAGGVNWAHFGADGNGNLYAASDVTPASGASAPTFQVQLPLQAQQGSTVTGGLTADSATVTGDSHVDGSQTVNGFFTVGGNGGQTTLKDPTTINAGLTVAQQVTAESNLVMRGTQYFQTSDGSNQFEAVPGAGGSLTLTTLSGGDLIVNSKTAINGALVVSGPINDGSSTLAGLPTANISDGAQLWCSDCKSAKGHAGMPVWWHASESAWTDALDNPLSN